MVALGLVLAGSLGAVTACSSGDSGSAASGTPTTTTPVPGSAKIVTFDAPTQVGCGGKPSTTITVSYATKGAKRQTLIVDGRASDPVTAASGQIQAPVHCDSLKHTLVLAAYDDKDRLTSQAKYLDTDVNAAG